MSEKYVKGYFLITYTGAQFLTCARFILKFNKRTRFSKTTWKIEYIM